jgi:L-fuconolactonase
MPIVDSHAHAVPCWFEPVESLVYQMDRYGVEHAVLVQINGQTDNRYQREAVRRFPGRFASVVMVNTTDPHAAEQLKREADLGASGVRLHPDTRSPNGDPLAIWRAAGQLGLSVSCGGMTAAEFATDDFAHVIAALPHVRIVLEHLGGGVAPVVSAEALEQRRRVFALARFPNVYLKVHGLGEFCRRALPVREPFPFETPIPPLLDMALEAFGAERLMWGSDYPLVSAREGYGNALSLVRQQLAGIGQAQRELIFGEVALRLFPIARQ